MIQLDESKLEKVMLQVLQENFPQEGLYVCIDSIDFDTMFINEDGSYNYTVKGNYGSEKVEKDNPLYSRPINLYLNTVQAFAISLGESSTTIAIDINEMNAYNPTTNAYMNRLVTGNYDNFRLAIGKNTITWTGTITQINIQNYSRWI